MIEGGAACLRLPVATQRQTGAICLPPRIPVTPYEILALAARVEYAFASLLLDETYLLAAARYTEQNPVRAGLAATPREYPWSSATAHVSGRDDLLVKASPLLELVGNWKGFLSMGTPPKTRSSNCTGMSGPGGPWGATD